MCICGALLVLVAGIGAGDMNALDGTRVVALDGAGWVIAPDPKNAGRDAGWWKQPAAEAKPASVPGIIQEPLPGYHGVAWYWREFTPPANPFEGGRYLLRFGAVDYLADVWVNDARVGGHEGSETPFVLDVTDAVKPGAPNRLAVRVLNPTGDAIDGIALAETPHRNKCVNLTVGGSYNYGGIIEPVELLMAPAVRIENVFVRADWKTGKVAIQANVRNAGKAPVKAHIEFSAGPACASEVAACGSIDHDVAPGDTLVDGELVVANQRLWQLDDPYLYRLETRLAAGPSFDENVTRFGFRDFRVEKGYFRLNGKRVFLKSSHTGNHCPIGQIVAPNCAPDLLRKDLLYMKSCGFNTIRFIAGIAHPYQLDLCDEIGLMVYEENLAGWCLADSPKMAERFDFSVREMVLRDRNHPSVTIYGLLNETEDGPVFRHAVASLALVRSLDDTRLVLLGSGRWDKQYNIGSVSNPGGKDWECVWGTESPDNKTPSHPGAFGGYMEGAGDAHVYPGTPHTPEIESAIRNLGHDTKPVFLSEYGIGSLMNAIRELRHYEQVGANPELDDFKYFKNTEQKLTTDWNRLGFDKVYAFPEDMLSDSQRMHCRQRLLGFDLIRSNPKICGYNLTGLLDHGFTGEGLWTYWREWKPGIVDALQDGWAPLRWCLFASPTHAYLNQPVKLEAVLANEDVLPPGEYPVTLRVMGPTTVVWEQKMTVKIPQPAPGEDPPLAVPVFSGEVPLNGAEGKYEFAARLDSGGAPAGGRLTLWATSPPHPKDHPHPKIAVWGVDEKVTGALKELAEAEVIDYAGSAPDSATIIVVGDLSKAPVTRADRIELLRRVANGSTAIFLSPQAFKKGDDPTGWLPVQKKGKLTDFPDWLYHKECVRKFGGPFAGTITPPGIMDWDYFGPVIPHLFFEGLDTLDATYAAAFAVCHSSRPDGYAAGVLLGAFKFGRGGIILNTLRIAENVRQHPAADALLLNLVLTEYTPSGTAAPTPEEFDSVIKEIGFDKD